MQITKQTKANLDIFQRRKITYTLVFLVLIAVFAGASCGRDSLRPAGYPLRRPLPPSEKVLPPVLGPAVPPPSSQGG